MAQCDLGERRNHHQPLDALRPMAETVLAVVCDARRGAWTTAGPRDRDAAPPLRPPPMSLRCVYTDLDGTLLGAGASLFRDGEGGFTLLPARALEACHRAGVEVVLKSGRRKAQVMEDARLIGQSAYIYEVGSGLVIDGEEQLLCGEFAPRDGRTPARADRRHRRARAAGARARASSRTRPGTWTGSSPTSTAARPTWARPTSCWRPRATARCG